MRALTCIMGGLLVVALVPVRGANITLDFLSSLLPAVPGQTVTFSATLMNAGATEAFLNGDSFTFPLPVDDTPFFLNTPPSLAPGQSFTGPVLNVNVPSGTPLGLYVGVFNVLGGDTAQQFTVLASRDFGVQVVPEPSAFSAMTGALLVAVLFRRRVRSA